ncbi:MAG: universal stress protein [Pirellulaceae bacterium]|nr:universal stress protein [Pirellulaceae bacterium]
MKRFKNILVATDTRWGEHPIVDEAVEIAMHNGASLKIVDVVPDFPWTVRLTLKDHEHMRELMGQEKQEKLDAMEAKIRAKGVDVETRVLQGKTSVEIIREVLRCEHDLVLRIHKGRESGG